MFQNELRTSSMAQCYPNYRSTIACGATEHNSIIRLICNHTGFDLTKKTWFGFCVFHKSHPFVTTRYLVSARAPWVDAIAVSSLTLQVYSPEMLVSFLRWNSKKEERRCETAKMYPKQTRHKSESSSERREALLAVGFLKVFSISQSFFCT